MTDAASPPGSLPGWYPDPGGQPVQRWWNGTGWTGATQPVPQAGLAPNAPHDGDATATLPDQPSRQPARAQGHRSAGRLRQFAWASVPVWSLGFLAFVPFLRLAFARRTAKAWGVFAAYFAASALEVILLAGVGSKGSASTAVGGGMIVLMGFAAIHAFISFSPANDALTDSVSFSSPQSNQQALATAQARMQRRKEARELARSNPVLARELRIGRPDMPRQYDDGGLVDVNNVPVETLTSALELTPREAAAVAAARTQLGRFTSPEELSVYADLAPDRVDAIRDLLLFG